MQNFKKKFLLALGLLIGCIIFYNKINFHIWTQIRDPLITGFAIAFAMTIPEFDYSKINFFKCKRVK